MIIFKRHKRHGQNIMDYIRHTSQKQAILLAPFKRGLTENKGLVYQILKMAVIVLIAKAL